MKIGIIGAGSVGSTTAFSLLMTGVAHKVILIDINEQKVQAEVMDIAHATPFTNAGKIKVGSYADLKGCEIVIITAGANQKPGESRLNLLERNVKIFETIIPQIAQNAPDTLLLITTNPVDIMTEVALKLSAFPKERVISSGTVLDTSRFRTLLGYFLGVSAKSIHADVLGEHGDSEVLIWSNATAGTLPLQDYATEIGKALDNRQKATIEEAVVNSAYTIIAGKGVTCYGIAGALTQICRAIANNDYSILTVSSHLSEIEDIPDIALSLPTVINKHGVFQVIYPHLSKQEHQRLHSSAKTIQDLTTHALSLIKTTSDLKSF